MKREIIKKQISRETKEVLPDTEVAELKELCAPYGAKRTVARKAKVDVRTLELMLSEGRATPKVYKKITRAIAALKTLAA